jgi:hypothetical protein
MKCFFLGVNFLVFLLEEIGSDRAHCECMRRFASFGRTHVIHCIITNFACLSGNKFMFLSRWTAHEQWNITFMLLKTQREEGHQFVNLLPDRHAKFVIIQWITCVVPKLANLLMHSQCALSEPISSSRRNISFKESIHNCNCGFPWFNLSLLIICCLWQLPFTGACGTDHPPFSIFNYLTVHFQFFPM